MARPRKVFAMLLSASVLATGAVSTGIAGGGSPAAAADIASVTCAARPVGSSAAAPPLPAFTAVRPRRLVDTRSGLGGVATPVGAGCTMRLDVEAAAVPSTAAALSLSVTALASRPGFLSVFPCRAGRSDSSNLNTRPGRFPTPNLVVALPDADREVCIFSQYETAVIVDLTGWWTTDGTQRFTSIPSVRADDSRDDPGGARVAGATIRRIDLAGIVPDAATAVVANLTVAAPVADTYLVAFPCGTTAPVASNLNARAGESRAVAAIVGLDANADLCVSSPVDVHVIVDVSGFYSPAPQFGPATAMRALTGRRLADSRSGQGGWTGKFGNGTVRTLRPAAGLPFASQATAVVLNVVATQADGAGYLAIVPCGSATGPTSVLNYVPGAESTNMVVVDLAAGDEICVSTSRGVHVVVDLFGVSTAPDGALVERLQLGSHTWPPYAPQGTDYVVECHDAPVDITLDLLAGTSARVNGVPVGPGTIRLPVGDDDLTRVELRRGGTVRNHWFRCVPDGFPRLEIERPGTPTPGWYLTTLQPGSPPATRWLAILDGRGVPVWYKQVDRDVVDLARRPDGRLVVTPVLGPRYGVQPDRGSWIVSLAGTLIAEQTTVDDPSDPGVAYPTDHHDYVSLPGGARAQLSYPLLDGQDLTVLGAGYLADDTIADGVIQEIDEAGDLVWSWRTSDHVGYDEVTFPVRWPAAPDHPGGEVDVFHLNSLGLVDDTSGDYIVSARHLDAVFRVDRTTGDIDWIVGSLPATTPNRSGARRLTIVGDPLGGPRRPHDARLRGDVLTLFDNRTATGQPARAVAYRIDTTAGTATMLWQIAEPRGRSSSSLGSNRLAADGSVLIDWGSPIQPMFEEYAADRSLLMRITQVPDGASYRIVKEPVGTFSAALLRATAGGFVEAP